MGNILLLPQYLDWTTDQRSIPYSIWVCPSSAGSGSHVVFSGVSSVSTVDAEVSGDKESVQIIQQNIKESLHLLDLDAETSRLGTIVLDYRNIRISGVSASRLKEFYSIIYQSNSIFTIWNFWKSNSLVAFWQTLL